MRQVMFRRYHCAAARRRNGVVESLEPRRLLSVVPVGPEFGVNTVTEGSQWHVDVASDAAGNSIAVWEGPGPNGGNRAVYAQRYDAAGAPVGGEFLVNEPAYVVHAEPDVAMDADGDFVVAWTTRFHPDDSEGVYARRFAANGSSRGPSFRVNVFTPGRQGEPSVAIDAAGNFLVTWQASSYDSAQIANGVYARAFNADGSPAGGDVYVAPLGARASAAAGPAGEGFVVAWEQYEGQGNPWDNGPEMKGVRARRFSTAGAPLGDTLVVNETKLGDQVNAGLAAAPDGDFLVTWVQWDRQSADTQVYGRRYDSSGAPLGGEFPVSVLTQGYRADPVAAFNPAGDLAVAWSTMSGGTGAGIDVFARSFAADGTSPGPEQRVNQARDGRQTRPAITGTGAGTGAGTYFVAWSGQSDEWGELYGRRVAAGPDVTPPAVVQVTTGGRPITAGQRLATAVFELRAAFTEAVSDAGGAAGAESVTNPANWRLARNGQDVSASIGGVTYGYDYATGLYTATVALSQSLSGGDFVLTTRDLVRDLSGNRVDGDADGAAGGDGLLPFTVRQPGADGPEFRVNSITAGAQSAPQVDSDAAGGFVVAWESADPARPGVFARRYAADGTPAGDEFAVTGPAAAGGTDRAPDVAVDDDGDFVVVWERQVTRGAPGETRQDYDVYARLYDRTGAPRGEAFAVAAFPNSDQRRPVIGMDADGDFAVAWESWRNVGIGGEWEIHGLRFAADGTTGPNNEFGSIAQDYEDAVRPALSMNARGDFALAWLAGPFDAAGRGVGIMAQVFPTDPRRATGFPDMVSVEGQPTDAPAVAIDDTGRAFVAWTTAGESSDENEPTSQYLYVSDLSAPAIRPVHDFTALHSDVSLAADADGEFVLAWAASQPGAATRDVYHARFTPGFEAAVDNHRVNTLPGLSASQPAVAADADGDFVVVFVGEGEGPGSGADGSDVFARRYVGGEAPSAVPGPAVAGTEDQESVVDAARYFAAAPGTAGPLRYAVTATSLPSIAYPRINAETGELTIGFGEAMSGASGTFSVRAADATGRWASATIPFTVAPVNDAPGHVYPAEQWGTGLDPVTFSGENGNAVWVYDPENEGQPVRVRLAATGGWITLGGTDGLTFHEGDGADNESVSFTAPPEVVNAALRGLRFSPSSPVAGPTGVTITTNDLGHVGAGGALEATTYIPVRYAPAVVGVYVGGTRWRSSFREAIESRGLGLARYGLAVHWPGEMLPVPWANVNQVSVQFNQDVSASLDALRASKPGGGSDVATGFSYDPDGFIATWTLPRPLAAGRARVDLDPAGVRGAGGGAALDGEWAPVSWRLFPSGDGAPGGAFSMPLDVLPGDTNRDRRVDALDLAAVRRRLGASASATPDLYDPFLDADADGRVTAMDVVFLKRSMMLGPGVFATALLIGG